MEPTVFHNEWVISLPQAYRKDVPARGDVILLRRPSLTQGYIVKRIVALPGDVVEIKDGVVMINAEPVDDLFSISNEQDDMEPLLVEPGSYFVLGDNRAFSRDSRDWEAPLVREEELRGKVLCTVFPRITKIQ